MSEQRIRTERHGPVLVVTIDRPEVKNSFDFLTAGAMSEAMAELSSDSDLAVGVLTGAGGTFSAGMDLKAFATRGEVPYVEKGGVFGVINDPPAKPLIAAVEGAALAGGLELLLVCDIVVAAGDATFGIPEVKRGLLAGSGGLMELPRRMPRNVANEMALTGDPIGAERAHALGLVNRLCAPGQALEVALELADRIAENAPLAIAATKRILGESSEWSAAEAWDKQGEIASAVFTSADAIEGAKAFAEKRRPNWQGA